MNSLFLKKLALAFALGAVPFLFTGLIGIATDIANPNSDGLDLTIIGTTVLALISGAVAAGGRAALAYWTDWFPTDKLHGSGAKPDSIVVTKAS